MKKILSLLILGIFLISLVSAFSICVDKTPPSAPSNLAVSGEVGNIVLTWDEATDEPSCSGIDSYVISRNDSQIGTTSSNVLIFIDTNNLTEGSYSYTVYAVDKVGHNKGTSINNDVVLSESTDDNGDIVVSGGGGGSSYDDDEDDLITITGGTTDTNVSDEEPEETTPTEPSEEGFFSKLTGAVVGGVTDFAKSKGGGISLILISLIGILVGFIIIKGYRVRKKKSSDKEVED